MGRWRTKPLGLEPASPARLPPVAQPCTGSMRARSTARSLAKPPGRANFRR
jgi:hypothetical protein